MVIIKKKQQTHTHSGKADRRQTRQFAYTKIQPTNNAITCELMENGIFCMNEVAVLVFKREKRNVDNRERH